MINQENSKPLQDGGSALNDGCGCTCHSCGRKYKTDLIVPDEIWDKIKPAGSIREGGLLCGTCIITRIENISEYSAWQLRGS
jgi:hypothetical protein